METRQVLRHRARKQLADREREKRHVDPLAAPLMALRNALGDFLVGEARRHAQPSTIVRPDGGNDNLDERAAQCQAIEDATDAVHDAFIRGLINSASPAMRLAILRSQNGLKAKLEEHARAEAENGEQAEPTVTTA